MRHLWQSVQRHFKPAPAPWDPSPASLNTEVVNQPKPFHFFSLPREVRDKIYAEAASDLDSLGHFNKIVSTRSPSTHGKCRYYASVTLPMFWPCSYRLVSKQFRQEFEEEVLRRYRVHCTTSSLGFELAHLVLDAVPHLHRESTTQIAVGLAATRKNVARLPSQRAMQTLQDILIKLATALPRLKRFELVMQLSGETASKDPQDHGVDAGWVRSLVPSFQAGMAGFSRLEVEGRSIEITSSLLITCPLFSIASGWLDEVNSVLDRSVAGELRQSAETWYRVQLEEERYAWEGLRFTPVHIPGGGSDFFKKALTAAEEERRLCHPSMAEYVKHSEQMAKIGISPR